MYELKVRRTNGVQTIHFLADEFEAKIAEDSLAVCQNVSDYSITDMLTGEIVAGGEFEK